MKLFCFWLGDNPLSEARRSALKTLIRSGLDVEFLRHDDLGRYIGESDLHRAYDWLSDNHKSDYLRAMFMHRFGGGYTDIKWIDQSWLPEVRRLEKNANLIAAGYPETNPSDVANNYLCARLLGAPLGKRVRCYIEYQNLRRHFRYLIGNGAFVFKPNTSLTARWWTTVNLRLDFFHAALRERPARYPREGKGIVIEGLPSSYPIPWIYLCGSIMHPLAFEYRERISRCLPPLVYSTYGHDTYL